MALKYRSEIDGLRAVAVVPVILFHAGISSLGGGFVGVDVFFVISGFLISSIIVKEVDQNEFTYRSFYERRLRRILPALITVLIATLLGIGFVGLPEHVIQTSKGALFALFGLSNIYFWSETGYFAPASEFNALLHTWSLGVEEQFYLLMPPALVLLARMQIRLKPALAIFLPVAFSAAVWTSFEMPSAAFYLLPARAWELALGTALAIGFFPKISSQAGREAVAWLGMGMIVLSVLVIDSSMPFPGYVALLPCVGTAAVIYGASADYGIGRMLSLGPVRLVGLISYSLYLWHWPIFTTARMYFATEKLEPEVVAAAIVLTFVMSWLTWKFIETPFRNRGRFPASQLVKSLAIGSSAIASIAAIGWLSGGLPQRMSPEANRMLSAATDIDPMRDRCRGIHTLEQADCLFGAKEAAPDFLIIGDSHAAAIRPALEQWAFENGRSGTLWWRHGCSFLVGAQVYPDADASECRQFKEKALAAIASDGRIKTIFIASRWEAAYSGFRPESGGAFRTYLVEDETTPRDRSTSKDVFKRALERSLQGASSAGAEAVLLGPVPEVGFDVPRILALGELNSGGLRSSKIRSRGGEMSRELDKVMTDAAKAQEARYVPLRQFFCRERCIIMQDAIPIYSDDDHLTSTAARKLVGPHLAQEL